MSDSLLEIIVAIKHFLKKLYFAVLHVLRLRGIQY